MTTAPDQAPATGVTSAAIEARLVPFQPQLQDRADSEELTQDTSARAIERSAQLRDPQAALAWLHRIATTVTLDRLRRRPVTVSFEIDERGVLVCDAQPESQTEEAT